MKFYDFLRPSLAKVLFFIAITAYFLAVKSEGFYQGDRTGTDTPRTSITVVGYPYVYFKTSPTGPTHFSTRSLMKNLVIFYVLACLFVMIGFFLFKLYREGEQKNKVMISSVMIYGFVGLAVLVKVFGGDWMNRVAIKENKKSIELLLALGVDPNSLSSDGRETPLMVAARKNNKQMARLFLGRGVEINKRNKDGMTALHIAAKNDAVEVAKILLASGANVNLGDYAKSVPLHYVKSYRMARMLVDKKANLRLVNKKGYPPVFFAPDDRTLRLFRSKGISLNISSEDGTTLLDKSHNPSIIQMLVKAGAPVNSRNADGETPLHKLIKLRNRKDPKTRLVMRNLLKRGANVDIRDKHGFSPLHYAIRNCDIQSGRVLISASREARGQLKKKFLRGKLKQIASIKPNCWMRIRVGVRSPAPVVRKKPVERAKELKSTTGKAKKASPKAAIKTPAKSPRTGIKNRTVPRKPESSPVKPVIKKKPRLKRNKGKGSEPELELPESTTPTG